MILRALLAAVLFTAASPAAEVSISPANAAKIGQRLWKNECGGTVAGLTSWNGGENFASLGIGHFIWYPPGVRGPYEESFPGLVKLLTTRGAKVPAWLASAKACPWPNRAAFNAAQKSGRMAELRSLLAATVPLQAEYAAQRSVNSLPKILAAAGKGERESLRAKFMALAASGAGLYCLMDYVNFKGEGTNLAERYGETGWGLLQVLQKMPPVTPAQAPAAFSAAAKQVLQNRINHAPKDETRWREGWFNRCNSYARGL
ncbi:MAG TPA: hypothetical protein VG796_21165 [Verrucomicrobiales bacterium]|nr:hypothetical protein [Verrucomicrobiales bacterium]